LTSSPPGENQLQPTADQGAGNPFTEFLHQRSPVTPATPLIQQLSPAALAYLGDTVYELYIRTQYLFPEKRLHEYHQQVVAQVRAEAQAQHLQLWLPHLTEAELDLVRRGRNAASGGRRQLAPELYQQASSLETLVGYLYLTDLPRLSFLLSLLQLRNSPTV
jgi:ribonuclease-3 family protein